LAAREWNGPHREGDEPKPMTHGGEKSDLAIVAMKSSNAAGEPAKEGMEPRAGAEENAGEVGTLRTPSREGATHGLARVRQAARLKKEERFTALLHHVDARRLGESYLALKREAAPGVDGVTWADYGQGLEARLEDLCGRVHRGAYRAQPSRRRFIPKPDGKTRPLGIAALEDKIVQRALSGVLNAIYEEDFVGFSYGFRPGRGQHDALDALAVGIDRMRVNWVLDADIAGFFDTVDHDWLIGFIEHRIGDQRVIRLIRKWLKAGVTDEDGRTGPTPVGTPQGAVISPLLANIYLHYVFDLWAHQWRRRHASGTVTLVRYADDIVAGFEHKADAERFMADLRERLAKFALTLHPEKTRLIEFGRQARRNREKRGLGKPETFDFLGFTHICGRTRGGGFQLRRKSRADRMRAKVRALKEELRRRWHEPIPEQGQWLKAVLTGWYNYHAVHTNSSALSRFRTRVTVLWLRALRRRSQKDHTTWVRMRAIAKRWLPEPRILHPWPNQRFAVRHPRWEPDALIGPVRFCAGGVQ
jgi:group II intron reverse transcriptase/maturase